MKNIVVLISGSGSNLQAILDACESSITDAKVCAVFSNKQDAYGLQRAKRIRRKCGISLTLSTMIQEKSLIMS